jgi:osmotically-inducible protein OsmY
MLKKILMLSIVLGMTGCAAAVIGGGAGAVAATGTDARGSTSVIGDQTLEHKINTVLDAQVPSGSFTVASYNSEVLLAGQVPSQKAYDKSSVAAINTVGVKKVWNYVTIGKKESLSDISKDTYITSAAKTRLIAQKEVNTNNIKVVTCAGVVYLLGKDAGSKVQVNGAIDGIRQISGVKDVVDLITF